MPARKVRGVRQPIMLTQTARKTEAGRYMLELYAKRRPTRAFWVEAVSSERKVVVAQEIRAWLDYTEDVSVDDLALVRCGCSALVARCGMYHAYMPVPHWFCQLRATFFVGHFKTMRSRSP
ncbi:hypothetical protein XGA_4992 [Xanthomonas hortorum ATCC 19865]|nr:hypothetical protein XGA_4992 [Xanthomonas hortorum ATCC 19865]